MQSGFERHPQKGNRGARPAMVLRVPCLIATLSGISAIAWNDPNAPWQEKKNEPTRAHTIPSLDKPAMRLYGIFSTVEGPWGAGGGMTWTWFDFWACVCAGLMGCWWAYILVGAI